MYIGFHPLSHNASNSSLRPGEEVDCQSRDPVNALLRARYEGGSWTDGMMVSSISNNGTKPLPDRVEFSIACNVL